MSRKHLQKYMIEFGSRHNNRPLDTIEKIDKTIKGMNGKTLHYKDLISEPNEELELLHPV